MSEISKDAGAANEMCIPNARRLHGATPIGLAMLCMLAVASHAHAAPAYSIKSDYVNDYAGVLSESGKSRIRTLLQEVEQKANAQIRLLVIPTTAGRDLHDVLMEIGRESGLGKKGIDHGVILGVAVQDRKWEFVTGEGIEDTLPDTYLYSVGQDYLVPRFKQGDYAGGLFNGLAVVGNRIAQAEGVTLSGKLPPPPQQRFQHRRSRGRGAGGVFSCMGFMLFFIFISRLAGASRGRGYRRWGGHRGSGGFWTGMLLGGMLGSSGRSTWGGGGSGWSGGSGFGGGGFGGGSFGGGSFGGGGAGGSW